MKCRYCGEENADSEKICKKCGSLLLAGGTDVLSEAETEAVLRKKRKKEKKLGILASALAVLFLAAAFLLFFPRAGKSAAQEGFYCIQAGDRLHLFHGADLLLSVEEPTDYTSVMRYLSGDGNTAYVLVREKGRGDGYSMFVMNGKTASRVSEGVRLLSSVSYDGKTVVYLSEEWEYHRYDRKTGKDEVFQRKDAESYFFHPKGETFVRYGFDAEKKKWVSAVTAPDGTVTEYPGLRLYPADAEGKTLFGYEETAEGIDERRPGDLVTVKEGAVTRLGLPGVASSARLRLNRDCTELLISADEGTWLLTADGNCRKLYDSYLKPLSEREDTADEMLSAASFLDGNYFVLSSDGSMTEMLRKWKEQLRVVLGLGLGETVYGPGQELVFPAFWDGLFWEGEYLSVTGLVRLQNGEAETVVSCTEETPLLSDLAESADGTVLAWLDAEGALLTHDFRTGREGKAENVTRFTLTPDGKELYYIDGNFSLYRLGEEEPLAENVIDCVSTGAGAFFLSGYYGKVFTLNESGEQCVLLSDIVRLETVGNTVIASEQPNAGDSFRSFYAWKKEGTFARIGSGIENLIPISEGRVNEKEDGYEPWLK